MSNNQAVKILSFIVLILIQGLVLNHINFLGYINPFLYILFILTYPATNNRVLFLLISFALGFLVDIFSDSGGIHAAASVFLAYIRPPLLKFSFGMLYDYQSIKFSQIDLGNFFIYSTIGVIFHHLIVFSLAFFNADMWFEILKTTLFSSIFSIVVILIIKILFSTNRK
jgi:rod shape-determining protein MreD